MDEVRTHAEVLQWLPARIAHGLEMAMPPEQRGWWTAAEAADSDLNLIEVRDLGRAEPYYLRGA